jgi:two-component system chemotaxis response regulator CheY
MPVLDGQGFRRAYRKTPHPHAPIVVLTAARDAALSASEIEADGFLAKPFDLSDLLGLVGRFTNQE